MMRRNQRKYWYPIIWVLIFGLANAGGRTDDNENFEILTEMDSNGEIKTNSTDVEILSDEIATNSYEEPSSEPTKLIDEFDNSYENYNEYDYGYDQTYTDFNSTESTKLIDDIAFPRMGQQPPDQDYASDEEAVEEFEVSGHSPTIVTLALGSMTILFIAGSIGAGYCSSRRPSISETRSSRGVSLSEPGLEGVISENQPLFDDAFDDNPVQNQNNDGTTIVQQV